MIRAEYVVSESLPIWLNCCVICRAGKQIYLTVSYEVFDCRFTKERLKMIVIKFYFLNHSTFRKRADAVIAIDTKIARMIGTSIF